MAEDADATPTPGKTYLAKRPHRKSRSGCTNCKLRRVKCSEDRPSCRACTLRKEQCRYAPAPARAHILSSDSAAASPASSDSSSIVTRDAAPFMLRPVAEPLPAAWSADNTDMKLLWFYNVKAYSSFSVGDGMIPQVDAILQVIVPQYALASPFLMSALLGVSALQMDDISTDSIPASRLIKYRAVAVEGYRRAVEEAKPQTFPALMACSLFLCVLCTQHFREPDAKPLFILDWIVLWRGIGLMTEMITRKTLWESGLALLFSRPRINLDESAKHVPSNLLFMVASIRETDEDCEYRDVYYDTLKVLGALYMDLEGGYGPVMELRIITFFTFLPSPYVEAARQRRPRALVIIAYWLVFAKLTRAWWMADIARNEIDNIIEYVGEAWLPFLEVPLAAASMSDKVKIGRLLLRNHAWNLVDRLECDSTDERLPTLVEDNGLPVIGVPPVRSAKHKPSQH